MPPGVVTHRGGGWPSTVWLTDSFLALIFHIALVAFYLDHLDAILSQLQRDDAMQARGVRAMALWILGNPMLAAQDFVVTMTNNFAILMCGLVGLSWGVVLLATRSRYSERHQAFFVLLCRVTSTVGMALQMLHPDQTVLRKQLEYFATGKQLCVNGVMLLYVMASSVRPHST